MWTQMQDKILAALTSALTGLDADLQVADRREYRTSGVLDVQLNGASEPLLRIGYNFQPGYAMLFAIPPTTSPEMTLSAPASVHYAAAGETGDAPLCRGAALAEESFWTLLDYDESTRFDDFVSFVSEVLASQRAS